MLLLQSTDKIELITGQAVSSIFFHASYIDAVDTTLVPTAGARAQGSITTATTTDIVAAPSASRVRNVKSMFFRNGSTSPCDVTVQADISGTNIELYKATLQGGQTLHYFEGVGFSLSNPASRFDRWLRVPTAYVNATTGWTDITGLTCPVESGKTYNFEAALIHANDASTTGSRFGINGPTLSNIFVGTIDTVTPSATAAAMSAGTATAVDTAASAQTTGNTANRLSLLAGVFTTGAAGTFAMRGQSEVAVANGLTVRAGSWCHVWEATG